MVPASKKVPPPPQLGLAAMEDRSWNNSIPRCTPSVGSGLPVAATTTSPYGPVQGASRTLPVRVAGILPGLLEVAVHLIPFRYGPVPVVVLKGFAAEHLLPEFASTLTLP